MYPDKIIKFSKLFLLLPHGGDKFLSIRNNNCLMEVTLDIPTYKINGLIVCCLVICYATKLLFLDKWEFQGNYF